MKKKLPFEEAIEGKLQQAALPDKERSWQAMEDLLNKRKKRRGGFYFNPFLAIVLLLAGTAAWYLLTTKDHRNQKPTAINTKQTVDQISNVTNTIPVDTASNDNTSLSSKKAGANIQSENAVISSTGFEKNDTAAIKPAVKTKRSYRGKMKASVTSPTPEDGDLPKEKENSSTGTAPAYNKENRNLKEVDGNTKENTLQGSSFNADDNETKKTSNPEINNASLKPSIENEHHKTDSSGDVSISIPATADIDTSNSKKEKAAAKPVSKQKTTIQQYTWSAGLGLQQQIPIAGQKITSYGYNGGNRIIDNYVPSLYLRFQKKKNWYIQGEFSYGAPRNVAAFAYNRITKVNSNTNEISTTTLTLKKTYYHELPLTFNYFITGKWSIGTGGMFGILHRTVSEKNTTTKNLLNQQATTISSIIPSGYTDSFLYRKQWHYILQTGYEWKRLAVGLRYSMDILPYIKYTLPSGELFQRKNKTLDVLIRFRIR